VSQEPPRVRLLAALSFEDRCVASLAHWPELDTDASKSAVFFSYDNRATPDLEANAVREANWRRVTELAESSGVRVSRYMLDPYSMGALEIYIDTASSDADKITIDLSCFTKLHLMAIARAVLKLGPEVSWSVCYASPLSYGNLNTPTARGGWQDNLVLSLGDEPSLTNQGMAVGVLLAGMEADRTAIAMSQLEPASGLIVLSCTPGRPDMHRLAMANNSLLFGHLRELRMPGPLGKKILPHFPSGGWEVEKVDVDSAIEDVSRCLRRIVRAASPLRAPVILFPFGPKIVDFVASIYLARHYPAASWAIYPVPKTHPLDYSDGIRATDWHEGADILRTIDEFQR
jgi:hypothetical protein